MSGRSDDPERVTLDDLTTMLSYPGDHHLGRLTFWSVNRGSPLRRRRRPGLVRRHVAGRVGRHPGCRRYTG